jgi:hypothetical protein
VSWYTSIDVISCHYKDTTFSEEVSNSNMYCKAKAIPTMPSTSIENGRDSKIHPRKYHHNHQRHGIVIRE